MIKAVIFDYNEVINRRLLVQPEILDYAARLRKKGIKTALLSNMYKPMAEFVKIRGKIKDFEPVMFGRDTGVLKPDPQAYQAMLDMLGLEPEECIFVDDKIENIHGAEELGMHVILSRNTAQTIDNIKLLVKANL
jgi:putative hydrolase of the HAD superfamily